MASSCPIDCPKRSPYCHSPCPTYKAFREDLEKNKKPPSIADEYKIYSSTKALWRYYGRQCKAGRRP